MPPEPATRRALLERMKIEGPQTAQTLATTLAITPMAVRQHLYALAAEGLVAATALPVPRGRPAKLWGLTEAAGRLFPDAHQDLAVGLLTALREALGEAGFERVLAQRTADQTRQYRQSIGAADLPSRLSALAEFRTREGYMAQVQEDGPGAFLLVENHCPVCAAARACTGICAGELAVFRAVLGPAVSIERTDHILAGARRCAYRITPLPG